MFLPWLVVVGIFAIAFVALIAYLTRGKLGHNVRGNVRHALVTPRHQDPSHGMKS